MGFSLIYISPFVNRVEEKGRGQKKKMFFSVKDLL